LLSVLLLDQSGHTNFIIVGIVQDKRGIIDEPPSSFKPPEGSHLIGNDQAVIVDNVGGDPSPRA
jgi:hypothetical protein